MDVLIYKETVSGLDFFKSNQQFEIDMTKPFQFIEKVVLKGNSPYNALLDFMSDKKLINIYLSTGKSLNDVLNAHGWCKEESVFYFFITENDRFNDFISLNRQIILNDILK